MATIADGPMMVVLDSIREMIANCYWWKRIEDANNAWTTAEALARCHIDALPTPASGKSYTVGELIELRPFALVWPMGLNVASIAVGNCGTPKARMIVDLHINVPDGTTNDDNALGEYVYQTVGRVMQTRDATKPGLMDLSGTGSYPILRQIDWDEGYERVPTSMVDDLGDHVISRLDIHWGHD